MSQSHNPEILPSDSGRAVFDVDTSNPENDISHLKGLGASGPDCWGPLQWRLLHQYARNYPDRPTQAHKDALVAYVTALVQLIPCPRCSREWAVLSPSVANATGSKLDAIKWSVDAHNAVNKRLSAYQPEKKVLTYKQAAKAILATCPGNRLVGSGSACYQPSFAQTQNPYYIATWCLLAALLIVSFAFLGYGCSKNRKASSAKKPEGVRSRRA